MPPDSSVRQRIERLLAENRVVLFMKGSPHAPQCGFSAKAAGLLDAIGADYAHVDVLADTDIREGIKSYGDWPTIPQLYVDGDLVGGSDIIEQMAQSGELHTALGLPPPDRNPPSIAVSDAAVAMLRQALHDAGGEMAVEVGIDAQFRTRLQLAPKQAHAITTQIGGIAFQFDPASARRAQGLRIDWADDARGRGLVIDNPNAPTPVRDLSVQEAAARAKQNTLTIVDVRPPAERALAAIAMPFLTLDDGGATLQTLPKTTPIGLLCHHGGRSAQAAAQLHAQGWREVYNIAGGIDAWSTEVDAAVPRYG